jgi:hypothetical protein
MSTSSYDLCTCGHNSENYDDFESVCKKWKCDVFYRHMRNH